MQYPTHSRVLEVVSTLREKPEHVRQNMALGVAGGITLMVAVGWFGALSASGTFALAPTSSDHTVAPQLAQTKDNFTQLLGAAGAAIGATTSPSTITIVNTEVHSTLDSDAPASDATVIHF